MRSLLVQRIATSVVVFCLVATPLMQPAVAGIISTETVIALENRQVQIDGVRDLLAQENVQDMLIKMGVDPIQASNRVDALTHDELQILHSNLDQLPAGATGILEVVGIVAIVLIILELLNVTNFFSEF